MWSQVQMTGCLSATTTSAAASAAMMLLAFGLSGCAEWPRAGHDPTVSIGPADALPVEAGAVDEGSDDWGQNASRSELDEIDIVLASAGAVDLSSVTPFEYFRVSGTLTNFGGVSVDASERPVFDCGQNLDATVRGTYRGDVDFLHIKTGAPEAMCAFLSVTQPCAEPGPDDPNFDLVAYRISDPAAERCDLLEGVFLTLESDQSPEPAWTPAGKFTPIQVDGWRDILLYVAGANGCASGSVGYEVKLVPVRHAGRCVELDTLGM